MTVPSLWPAGAEWTIADLQSLPPGVHAEIHTGNLVVKPPAGLWHQDVEVRLCSILARADRHAFTRVGLSRRPNDARVPDVGVFHSEPDDLDATWHDQAAIALVAEVWSPSSDEKDRNPRWYLAHDIPEYWLAEPIEGEKHDALVTMYRRGRNLSGLIEYVEHRQARLSELERDGL